MRVSQETGLVGRDHVLDVDECILATSSLKKFQGLHDQVAHVLALPLGVLDAVAQVAVGGPEEVEDWKNLPVVWDKHLPDVDVGPDHALEHVDRPAHDDVVLGVQCTLDGHDHRGHCRRYERGLLPTGSVEHVLKALVGNRGVRLRLLQKPIEEDRQVIDIVKLLWLNLPLEAEVGSVLHGDREITALVEAAQHGRWSFVDLKNVLLVPDAARMLRLVNTGGWGSQAPIALHDHPSRKSLLITEAAAGREGLAHAHAELLW
mmetsp:Transcript_78775/g.231128  ORF Transcript_78775/g.231128 Transcript_78775/m.231128 type:complete len:261 (+) Transcript_78775:166-948(+)